MRLFDKIFQKTDGLDVENILTFIIIGVILILMIGWWTVVVFIFISLLNSIH